MKHLITVAVAVGTLGLAAPAFAQGWGSVYAQQARIETRIDRGLRDGSLTRGEAARLRGESHGIRRLEGFYRRNDGRLDRRERADLSFRLERLNRQVFAERNDWRRRRWG